MKIEFPEKFNMADYFLYHNIEEGRENKTCLCFEDKTYTYGDAVRMSNRAGNALRDVGVEIEDRVLIVLPDCPEFVWTWFGASRIGAVITMVNPLLPPEDYKYYLDYTRARAAVIHESLLKNFEEAAKDARYLKQALVVGDECGRFLSFDKAVNAQPETCAPADTHRDDIAIWLFTSGSTGHPKGAAHLQHDLPYNTEVFAKRTMGVNENDLTVSVPKLFFGYATGTNLLFPFAVGGATALFSERSTPEKMFEVIELYRPTILTTVPTMINAMLNLERRAEEAATCEACGKRMILKQGRLGQFLGCTGYPECLNIHKIERGDAVTPLFSLKRDLSSLRFCYSAGEALPVELYTRWKATFGVEICDGIGSAEMFHIYITNRPGDVKLGSLGRVVEGYEAKIVDADAREVATGEMGTLCIKGDSAALCYWNAHEKSKETFAGDWCMTGDQFHVDREGYYWYHGRTDDMLKVSGVFVAPAEIENCLLQHESVLEAAVIGHDAGDELIKPKAFIVLRPPAKESEELAEELKDFVKSKLALYKYPRWIEFVSSLPKNDRGKLDRKKLKQ